MTLWLRLGRFLWKIGALFDIIYFRYLNLILERKFLNMKPVSISEKMMFNTVRLVASDNSSGTGFFYNFNIDDKIVPVIITNKHVVRYNQNETMQFFLHLTNGENESNENYQVTLSTNWIFHSNKDLCFCFVNPVFEHVKEQTGKDVFYIAIDDTILPTQSMLEDLSALEELVMVGYPIGMWDKKNNFPIFRKGYTSSHPAIDFNEAGIGLVDMACFPGSSGSPIYILNEGGYKDKRGNWNLGNSRIIFIGTLFAGPQYDATGDLIVKNIPTVQQKIETHTGIMANLGYYVKASEIFEFKNYIKAILSK